MKNSVYGWCLGAMAALLGLLPASVAQAQSGDVAPALVVSVGPSDQLLKDILYVTKAAGQPFAGGALSGIAGQFLGPIDTQRPAGMYLTLETGVPNMVVFAPVTDFEGLIDMIAEQTSDPETDGDYTVFSMPNGEDLYLIESGAWTYASNNKDALANLPEDPSAWLEGVEEYDLAVRVLGQNVPAEMKQMAMDAAREGYDGVLDQLPPDQAAQQREMSAAQMDQLESLIQDLDEMVVGLSIDSKAKEIRLDTIITALDGSTLSEQMELQSEAQSEFLGFLIEGAAMNLSIAQRMNQADASQVVDMLDKLSAQGLEEMNDDPNMSDEERDAATGLVEAMVNALSATLESGKIDGGAAVILNEDTVGLVAGFYLLETQQVEDAIKSVVDLVRNEAPPGVEFNLDARQENGTNWHEIVIPVTDEQASAVLGETVSVWLGVAPEAIYLSVGKNAAETLATAIDANDSAQATKGRSVEMNLDLGRMIQFGAIAQPDEPMTQMMAQAVEGKNATVSGYGESIENGSRSRIVIREGFLNAIGEIIGMAMQQGGAQF